MGINSTAGTTIGISSAAPATFDATGYAALTYTNIGEVTNLGALGRTYAEITHKPIANRAVKKRKGSYDEGKIPLTFAIDEDDAGQTLLQTASEDDDDYYFKITYQSGAKRYFPAQVMGFPETSGGVDDILSGSSDLNITGPVVRVAAP